MGLMDFPLGRKSLTEAVRPEPEETIREGDVHFKERYIAFDVETTGLSYTYDRVVEFGAVLFVGGSGL